MRSTPLGMRAAYLTCVFLVFSIIIVLFHLESQFALFCHISYFHVYVLCTDSPSPHNITQPPRLRAPTVVWQVGDERIRTHIRFLVLMSVLSYILNVCVLFMMISVFLVSQCYDVFFHTHCKQNSNIICNTQNTRHSYICLMSLVLYFLHQYRQPDHYSINWFNLNNLSILPRKTRLSILPSV